MTDTPRTEDSEGQAMAFRTFGEQIAEIGLREISEDRSLTPDEVHAVAYCARNLLKWCEAEALPTVEALAAALRTVRFDKSNIAPDGTWDLSIDEEARAILAAQKDQP